MNKFAVIEEVTGALHLKEFLTDDPGYDAAFETPRLACRGHLESKEIAVRSMISQLFNLDFSALPGDLLHALESQSARLRELYALMGLQTFYRAFYDANLVVRIQMKSVFTGEDITGYSTTAVDATTYFNGLTQEERLAIK